MTNTFGPDYDESLDGERIRDQMAEIGTGMARAADADRWLALDEIEAQTGYARASISAQLRHLLKKKVVGQTVEKLWRDSGHGGAWEYIVPTLVGPSIDELRIAETWGADTAL